MAEYKLTQFSAVIRVADGASVPNDPGNRDRIAYNAWFAGGGVPDPYAPPTRLLGDYDTGKTIVQLLEK